ncbi:unnamed protein product [Protopolystoma xenopodis]|uniref:Uncharacterized protein n=1 Tax=Protopolystoma xenopodis TaxID=117903 RepID=A0A3S5AEF0_9PLAT|nr:unnamed protein product [Protopolystoma xenopodis]
MAHANWTAVESIGTTPFCPFLTWSAKLAECHLKQQSSIAGIVLHIHCLRQSLELPVGLDASIVFRLSTHLPHPLALTTSYSYPLLLNLHFN